MILNPFLNRILNFLAHVNSPLGVSSKSGGQIGFIDLLKAGSTLNGQKKISHRKNFTVSTEAVQLNIFHCKEKFKNPDTALSGYAVILITSKYVYVDPTGMLWNLL